MLCAATISASCCDNSSPVGHGRARRSPPKSGLDKSTVSRLVTELKALGLVAEGQAEARSRIGRPGLVVDVARDGVVALGLEINVGRIGVQATDLCGGSRYRAFEAADNRFRGVEAVLDRLAELATDALDKVRLEGLRPIGITVALPGLVDTSRGVLLAAPNLQWMHAPVVALLRERLQEDHLPITADNEANLAALAELWEGAVTGPKDFVYVSGNVGVGSGLVLDGELFRGYRGFGGEFGHTTVEADGLPCVCGSRGCLETRAGLKTLLAAAGVNGEQSRIGSGRSLRELLRQARAGDENTLAALGESGRWLGVALSSVVNLLSPRAIVLGGYFAPLEAWLRPRIELELATRVLGGIAAVPPVAASSLGHDAPTRGAAATHLRRVLADPTLVSPRVRSAERSVADHSAHLIHR